MAKFRTVKTEFWNDKKVSENFTPEDKLFMLYLLTNEHSSQLGIYKISIKLIAFEIGWSKETVSYLLERFEKNYDLIRYCKETDEIAIKNFLKHSIHNGGKPIEDLLKKEINEVKNIELLVYIYNNINNIKNKNITLNNILDYIKEYINNNNVSLHDTLHESSSTTKQNLNVVELFEYWNSKKIRVHQKITDEIEKQIEKALKENTLEDIKKYIDRYNRVIKDKSYFFSTCWSLVEFLKQKNAMNDFKDDGSKWVNYINQCPNNTLIKSTHKFNTIE